MPAQGNSVAVPGYDFSGVRDIRKQMAAYDALPVTVRRALDTAPFEICCVATLAFYREHNASQTVIEIKDSGSQFIQAANPGTVQWSPTVSSSPITQTARRASDSQVRTRRHSNSVRLGLTVPTVAAC
jgi:hypothetical protein